MESEESQNILSFDSKDNSVITSVTIELEKVTDDSSNIDEKNFNGGSIAASSKDKHTKQEQQQSKERARNESSGNNPIAEVQDTVIRYFKGIGLLDPTRDSATSEALVEQVNKSPPPVISQAIKSVQLSFGGMVRTESHVNLNESRYPKVKPQTYEDIKCGKVELFGPDVGPRIYNVKGNIISRPIITKNLPDAYRAMPVHGRAETQSGLKEFIHQKLRDYIGYGLSDTEFGNLQEYMDGDYLRTGYECTTPYRFPSQGPLSADLKSTPMENGPGKHLCIVKKFQLRVKKDLQNHYPRKLKYRGLRMLPLSLGDEYHIKEMPEFPSDLDEEDGPLEPGRDLIFRARMYRPHSYGSKRHKEQKPTRHSVFNNDLVVLGRQRLSAFRDRIACANDIGMRIDVSDNPDCFTDESAKQIFPSGFLFINNVFYVDTRAGCVDHSAVVRDWARGRGLGNFPVQDMNAVRLDEIVLRLGHPEVYIHQGKCEHLFTFSEVRLLGPTDPMRLSHYPCFTYISQNQSVYCTTCAEFGAKWIVVGSNRVPFDPAFFCDTCFRFYLYDRDGNKIGDFKAYSYKGNTVNFMKPISGQQCTDDGQSDNDEDAG